MAIKRRAQGSGSNARRDTSAHPANQPKPPASGGVESVPISPSVAEKVRRILAERGLDRGQATR